MKHHIKDMILTICCSYTVVVAFNVFLSDAQYMMAISAYELRQTFWLCVAVSLVVQVLVNLNYPKEWMVYMASFFGMLITVFGLGSFVFHLIPIDVGVYSSVTVMCSIVYLLCRGVIFAIEKSEAEEINEKLNEKRKFRKENKNGKHY